MLARALNSLKRLFRSTTPFDLLLQSRANSLRGTTAAKIHVNESTALRYSAVYASIRVYAETIGALPIEVFHINPKSGTRQQVYSHPVAQRLAQETGRPHPDMTAMVWQETRQAHLSSWGNSYTEITWGERGELIALTPRHPSLVTPFRSASGELLYEICGSDGSVAPTAKKRTLDSSQMLHVPGLGGDGIIGWSPIRLAMETIGTGLGQERMAGTYFGNSARPSLLVEYPGKLDDAGHAQLEQDLNTNYSGDSAHRALLLEGGLKATAMSIPLNEAQFLESREFSGEEIACRWFGLPPHVVGFMKKGTLANVQEMDAYFEKHSIGPKLIRHECELNTKLFTGTEAGQFVVRYNTNALLRMNAKDRYEAHKTAILSGQITQNEARRDDDRDPLPGGDVLLRPEAIFGKSGGEPAQQASRDRQATGRLVRHDPLGDELDEEDDDDELHDTDTKLPVLPVDQRLLTMTHQALSGLLNREKTFVLRAANKPQDFIPAIRVFYCDHERHLTNKFADIADAAKRQPLLEECVRHRDQLLALGERVTPGDVRELCDSWDLTHLAELLLGAAGSGSET